MTADPAANPLLRVLSGDRAAVPPIWLMRQAGRYLPEYRAVRAQAESFLGLCLNPQLAAELTLQPIRRFGFDAAILFSDILMVPHALGQRVNFVEGEGPRLDALADPSALSRVRQELDHDELEPVYQAISMVKGQLEPMVALLGFCGAPWTVASYMIAGRGSADQLPARTFAYRHPDVFAGLIDVLAEASAGYLIRQLKAGVDAVQVFDSWAGILPGGEFRRWCIEPMAKIVKDVRKEIPAAKIIGFPRAAGTELECYLEGVAVDAIGLDWTVELAFARRYVQPRCPVQGNLDPLALLVGGPALDRSIDTILDGLASGPFIFNLGHGILPDTPIAHVERLVARVRRAANN